MTGGRVPRSLVMSPLWSSPVRGPAGPGGRGEYLPVLWDADFLFGPKTADGEDTYVLCEVNASSVIPFPPEAVPELASATLQAVTAAKAGRQ